MIKALVLRGLGVGALGGLVAFVVARVFAEPVIQAAIEYESTRDEVLDRLAVAAGNAPAEAGPDIFSRTVQANVGIGVGMVLFGAALGSLFAVAFCLAHGRTGRLRPRNLAMLVALLGFGTLYLVPSLKYPANPPSIGHEDTIRDRSGLYLVMVIASVALALTAVWLGQRLRDHLGNYAATILSVVAFAVLIGVVMVVLPPLGHLQTNLDQYGDLLTETPQPLRDAHGTLVLPGFDADLLYRFRLYSALAQALMWSVIGLTFAPLAERIISGGAGATAPTPRTDSSTSGATR